MTDRLKKRIGVTAVTLILFYLSAPPAFSLVLTENIYTIPDEGVELLAGDEILTGDKPFNTLRLGLGLGLLTDFSVWFQGGLLCHETANPLKGQAGDGMLKFRYYMGDYLDQSLHVILHLSIRIPGSHDAYRDPEWRNAVFGNHEISWGTAARYDLRPGWFLHAMFLYTFRADQDEDFYGGFNLNPARGETYKSLFGLNPFRRNSFLYYERLRNDILSFSAGISTDRLYPLIPSFEARWNTTIVPGQVTRQPIPPYGVDPLVLAVETRYFFSRAAYVSLYCGVNVLAGKNGNYCVPGIGGGIEF